MDTAILNLFPRFDPHNPYPEAPELANLLPNPGLVLLCAPPKTGKTTLAAALAWAVATGGTFADTETEKAPALFLDFEGSREERARTFAVLPTGEHPDHALYVAQAPYPLDHPMGLLALDTFLKERRPRLVVIDSLHGALAATDLARARAARRLLESQRHARVRMTNMTDRAVVRVNGLVAVR